MIDKRISYAFGGTGGSTGGHGGHGGGGGGWGGPGGKSPGSGGKTGTGGDNAKEKAIETAAKTKAPTRHHAVDTPTQKKEQKAADELNRQKAIKDLIAQQQIEKYDVPVDPTKFGETVEDLAFKNHPEYKEQEAKKAIKQLSTKAGTKEALREFKALKTGREYKPNISLLDKLKIPHSFVAPETPKKGLWGTLGNVALGILAPQLLGPKLGQLWSGYNQAKNLSKFASNYTGKDYVGDLTSNLTSKSNVRDLLSRKTTTDTTDTRDDRVGQRDERDGRSQALQKIAAPKDVITESVQKFTPSKEQLTEVQKRRAILQEHAAKGALNERGQNTLLQMNQFLEKYLVSVAHGGRIDRPLMGRSRDI